LPKALEGRREEGFTLVELMIVVLIIAIVIAIAMATFPATRDRAQDRAAQADLRNDLPEEHRLRPAERADRRVHDDRLAVGEGARWGRVAARGEASR